MAREKMITDSVLEIIEDHVRICDTIDWICCAIENGYEYPNFIPVLHDTLVTDQLSQIVERLRKEENGKA